MTKPISIALASQSSIKSDAVLKELSFQLDAEQYNFFQYSIAEIDKIIFDSNNTEYVNQYFHNFPLADVNNDYVQLEQPVNEGGLAMARLRIQKILCYQKLLQTQQQKFNNIDYIIAIENYIIDDNFMADMDFDLEVNSELNMESILDVKAKLNLNFNKPDHSSGPRPKKVAPYLIRDKAVIIIYSVAEGLEYIGYSESVLLPSIKLWSMLKSHCPHKNSLGLLDQTYGQALNKYYPEVDPNNWYLAVERDRLDILRRAFRTVCARWLDARHLLRVVDLHFQEYNDFPIVGVRFLDWGNLFLKADLLRGLIHHLASKYKSDGAVQANDTGHARSVHCDYVAGLESRGFMLGVCLAQELGVGFIPIKKAGKEANPSKVSRSYQKEYGPDSLEMRADLVGGGVIIVDDILATGGSMLAAAEMVQDAGHWVVDCLALRDVPALRSTARQALENYPVRVVIQDQ